MVRAARPTQILGDVADVQVARGKKNQIAIQNGNPAMGVRIDRQNGANVLAALTEVKAAMDELREGPLKELGLDVTWEVDPAKTPEGYYQIQAGIAYAASKSINAARSMAWSASEIGSSGGRTVACGITPIRKRSGRHWKMIN